MKCVGLGILFDFIEVGCITAITVLLLYGKVADFDGMYMDCVIDNLIMLNLDYNTMLKYEVFVDDSSISYYRYNEPHRKKFPAYINKTGYITWWQYGERLSGRFLKLC